MPITAGSATMGTKPAPTTEDETITSLDWEYETITTDSTGRYYLYNLSQRLFLNDDNTLGNTATTLWTVDSNQISSQNGKYLSLTSQNEGSLFQPKWVFTASSSSQQAATTLLESVDSTYYLIGNNVNINVLQRQARYLTAEEGVLGVTPSKEPTEEAQWIFISTEQYERKTADIDMNAFARSQAIEALGIAIAAAEAFQSTLDQAPKACKTELATTLAAAKTMKVTLDKGGILAKIISTQNILNTANQLEETIAKMAHISDYYLGVMEEIDRAEQISQSLAMKAIITAARSGAELSTSTSALNTVANTMHFALVGYMQGVDSLEHNQDITGLLSNHSFDRGNMDGWTGLNVDLKQIDITSISTDNLGSLAKALQIGMREGTMAIANQDEAEMQDVHGNYYMQSDNQGTIAGQPISQFLMGLPAGNYQLSARMSTNPGLLRTNTCHLTVLTIPYELVKEVLGEIELTNPDLANIAQNIDFGALLPIVLEQGKIISQKNTGTNINTLADVTVDFEIQKNDIVVMVLNGGLTPLAGTAAYRADNMQLTYLHAPIVIPEEDPEEKEPEVNPEVNPEDKEQEDKDSEVNPEDKDPEEKDPEEQGGDEDHIFTPKNNVKTYKTYDMNGRLVKGNKKGIILRNGKKFRILGA